MDRIIIVIIVILMLLPFVPLILFHDYFIHFFRFRSRAKKLDPQLKPSLAVLTVYIFIIITYPISFFLGVPAFLSMSYSSISSEARMNLLGIYENEQAYHEKYGHYAEGEHAFNLINWDREGSTLYMYLLGKDKLINGHGTWYDYRPHEKWPFAINPDVSPDSFTAMAIGNVDTDECPDVWIINDSKQLYHVVEDRQNIFPKGYCIDCPWASGYDGALWTYDKENKLEAIKFLMFPLFLLDLVILLFVSAILAGPERGKHKKLKALIKKRGSEA